MVKFTADNLNFNCPITEWEQAIPLGNGIIGALVHGGDGKLRISLDRNDLWDMRQSEAVRRKEFNYPNYLHLIKEKKFGRAEKLFGDFYEDDPFPTKIPAGAIEITLPQGKRVTAAQLAFKKAVAHLSLENAEIEMFLSAENFCGYIHTIKRFEKIELENKNFTKETAAQGTDLFTVPLGALDYPPAQRGESGGVEYFVQKAADGFEFAVLLKKNDETAVYYIACTTEGENWLQCGINRVNAAFEKGFFAAKAEHCKWWNRFFAESSVSLCDKQFEKLWYLNNYFLGSVSRKGFPPMPLQGVWTADRDCLPPWKGDYHNDLNTEMSYQGYLKANHIDAGSAFVDFLINHADAARSYARDFYRADGLCYPATMDICGRTMGGWSLYTTSMTPHLWLCFIMCEHCKYTDDFKLLKEKVYPFLLETSKCILHYLTPDSNGVYTLPLSTSPEMYENEPEAAFKHNSAFDISLLRCFFSSLCDISKQIGDGKDGYFENIYNNLPPVPSDARFGLKLCEGLDLPHSHRHHSHCMAIYPLKMLDYGSDKAVMDATLSQLERFGSGRWTGFSFTWMSQLYAHAKNGEGAYYQLKLFFDSFCSSNGFHLNGDYKMHGVSQFHYMPFTLEANMCSADAIQEMLLQQNGDAAEVFPAIPQKWKAACEFKNFRLYGGVLISASMKNGKVNEITLLSQKDKTVSLVNSFESDVLKIGEKEVLCKKGDIFKTELKKKKKLIISPAE